MIVSRCVFFFNSCFQPATVHKFTHSLLLQVVPHLLVLVLRQLLVTVLIVLSEDGLDLCVRVAFPAPRAHDRKHITVLKPKPNQTLRLTSRLPEVRSPFQVLTELIKVELPTGLTQTVGDVVHGRLLQPELHQRFVAALRRRRR